MYRITLTLTLTDPIVISQSNATKGIHQSLDYIPGANILGAIASQSYSIIKDGNSAKNKDANKGTNKAFDIFHSGKVRFGNALPLVNNQPSYPIPFSFYYGKGKDKNTIKNGVKTPLEFADGVQPKQHRQGYINTKCEFFTPIKHSHLRTAIDRDKAIAKEAALFGYQSLNAGLQLQAHIDADNQEDLVLIEDYLQTFKIGRSRSAHYGRVEVSKTEIEEIGTVTPTEKHLGQLILWLSSDLIVYNQDGQPTLTPTLEDLGLGKHKPINSEKSFIRTRKYATYNGKRRSYDLEKQVIMQGSVLVYDEVEDIDTAKLHQGLGAYTEAGYGQVVPFEQSLINNEDLTLTPSTNKTQDLQSSESALSDLPTLPDLPLLQFLQEKQALQANQVAVNKDAAEKIKHLFKRYENIRKMTGESIVGPSKSQWGLVREVATKTKATELCAKLFTNADALIRDNHINNNPWVQRDNEYSFAQYLQEITHTYQDLQLKKLFIRTLARTIANHQDFNKHHKGTK